MGEGCVVKIVLRPHPLPPELYHTPYLLEYIRGVLRLPYGVRVRVKRFRARIKV